MKNILVFGTGSYCEKIFKNYREELDDINILAFIDNNKQKHGQKFMGKHIISVQDIDKYEYDMIAICSSYFSEIKDQLIEIGIEENCITIIKNEWYFLINRIRNKYKEYYNGQKIIKNDEIGKLLKYLEENYKDPKHFLNIYNYNYIHKYYSDFYEVYKDSESGMNYVVYNNKKMFFPKNDKYSEEYIKWYFATILSEQDKESPHRYNIEDIKEGDVVLDVGTAEGIFSLSIIDKVSKIYLFEMNDKWLEALKKTFEPYKEKVVIINKRIGLSKECTKLDDILKENKVDYIKMDIDGYEADALESGENIIMSNNLSVAACSYHNLGDQEKIIEVMKKYNMDMCFSPGYMLTFDEWGNYDKGFSFKKGIVYGKK